MWSIVVIALDVVVIWAVLTWDTWRPLPCRFHRMRYTYAITHIAGDSGGDRCVSDGAPIDARRVAEPCGAPLDVVLALAGVVGMVRQV